MKKGLITAVGTMILAIAGGSYAKAPTITGVPDIVISDAEDRLGGTQDLNFFRYVNAFNIMSYTRDDDSSASQLKWAFTEDGFGSNLEVNGKTELTNPAAAASDWTPALTGADGYWWSFRNVLYSPHRTGTADPNPAGGGGPKFPDPTLENTTVVTDAGSTATILPWSSSATARANNVRVVSLFVADEAGNTNVAAPDSINVYVENKGADALTGTFTTQFTDSSFALAGGNGPTLAGWQFTQYAFTSFAKCTSSGGNGGSGASPLGISSGLLAGTASGSAYFARWIESQEYSAPIPFITGNIIYCAKMRMELTSATNSKTAFAPNLWFGVENGSQQLVTTNMLFTQQFSPTDDDSINPQIPTVGTTRDYRVYWGTMESLPEYSSLSNLATIDWRRWRVFFQIVDPDTNVAGMPEDGGQWKLTRLEVDTLPRPDDVAPVSGSSTNFKISDLTTNAVSANGGGFASNPSFAMQNTTITMNSPSPGMITFHAGAQGASHLSTYALWEKKNVAPWTVNKVVRVSARLSCPTAADRTAFELARIRNFTPVQWIVSEFGIYAPSAGLIAAGLGSARPLVPNTIANSPNGDKYEVYVPHCGGPNAFVMSLLGAPALQGARPDQFLLGLDTVATSGSEAALAWTVHEVMVESLDEPALQ